MKRLAWIVILALTASSAGVPAGPAKKAPKKAEPAGKKPADARAKAWLGVVISEVPDALAAHLRLKDAGVMVRNVAKGSPADKAGLERYDVIVAVGGSKVTSRGGGLPETIGALEPGRKVELAVRKGGKQKKLSVRLGKTPDHAVEYKYEPAGASDGDSIISRVLVHPPMTLRMGPKGWRWQDKADLPEEVRKMLESMPKPPFGSDIRVEVKRMISATDDGGTIHVEQDGDGEITVRRTRKGKSGKEFETEKSYGSADELRRKDKEAHELYRKAKVVVSAPGMGLSPDKLPRLGGKDIQDAVRKALGDARTQMRILVRPKGGMPGFDEEQIMKHVRDALRRGGLPPTKPPAGKPKPKRQPKDKPSPPRDGLQQRLSKTLRALPPDQRKALVRQMAELIQQSLDQALQDAASRDEKPAKPEKPKKPGN